MFKVPTPAPVELFEFEIEGTEYTVRKVKFLPIGLQDQIAETGGNRGLLLAFEGPAREAVGELLPDQFDALTDAWFTDSGINLGESEASESS